MQNKQDVLSPLQESPRQCLGCENRRNLKPFLCRRFAFPFSFEREKRDFTHLDALYSTKTKKKKNMSATIPTTAPFFLSSRSSTGAFDPSSSSPFFCSRDAAPRSQRAPDARKNAHLFFCFCFFLLSQANLRRRRKRFLTEKKAGRGTSLKRGARGKRGGHDETRTRANDCFARAREWVRPPIASRGDERKRFPKKCARTSAQCCFLVASRRPLSFSLSFVRGMRLLDWVSTLTSATSSLLPPKPTNRFQSCLRVHDHREASLRLPIPRRSQAKQSRSHHPHPKATHVQQGSKIGNRHAHQKGPNLSRNVVTVRHGRQRRGVGEINQRSDEKRR